MVDAHASEVHVYVYIYPNRDKFVTRGDPTPPFFSVHMSTKTTMIAVAVFIFLLVIAVVALAVACYYLYQNLAADRKRLRELQEDVEQLTDAGRATLEEREASSSDFATAARRIDGTISSMERNVFSSNATLSGVLDAPRATIRSVSTDSISAATLALSSNGCVSWGSAGRVCAAPSGDGLAFYPMGAGNAPATFQVDPKTNQVNVFGTLRVCDPQGTNCKVL